MYLAHGATEKPIVHGLLTWPEQRAERFGDAEALGATGDGGRASTAARRGAGADRGRSRRVGQGGPTGLGPGHGGAPQGLALGLEQ